MLNDLGSKVYLTWLQNSCTSIFSLLLSVPSYWTAIKPSTHINLIRLYRGLLHNYPVSDTAAGNARVFRLLFSCRIPGTGETSVGIPQVSENVEKVLSDEVVPLMDFARRTNPRALHEFVGALNLLLLDSAPSRAHVVLGPLMTRFNDILISHLSRPRFDVNIINYFRLQLRLLVTPDGRFDSGLESIGDDKEAVLGSAKRSSAVKSTAEDPDALYRSRDPNVLRSSIIGESTLFNALSSLVSLQNANADAMKASKAGSLDSDLYSLYQLVISLFLKKLAYRPYAAYTQPDSMKKTKIEDDPRRLLHTLIFDSMSSSSEASDQPADNSLNSASPSAKYAYTDLTKREKPASHTLSWLQLTYILVAENPYFFNKSWASKLICDLLTLLEYNSGVVSIEVWIYRLLSALALSSRLHRDSPIQDTEPESLAASDPDSLETNDGLDDLNGELSELLGHWKRVWTAVTLKLGHIDLVSGESALGLLEKLIRHDLVPKSLVQSSQSALLRLPIISEYQSWDAISFLIAIAEKYALVGTGHRNESGAEVILNWFDGALFKSYSEAVFKSESMVDPSQLACLLLTAITGTPVNSSEVPRRDSCHHLHHQLQTSDFELSVQQFASARLLSPSLDPYRRLCDLSSSGSFSNDLSGVFQRQSTSSTSKISVDHMPLSEAKKTELTNQLMKILATRLGQTKSDSPVQSKRRSLVLDGSKLIQLVRKQVFQGCLLISVLLKLPTQRSPLHTELEVQLRELSELIESNLKLCEGDPSVAGSIYREISRLALSAAPKNSFGSTLGYVHPHPSANQNSRSKPTNIGHSYLENSTLQNLFGSLLDSAKAFVSSIPAPSRSASSVNIFASQAAAGASQRPLDHTTSSSSLSRAPMDVDDPYMNLGVEAELDDDGMALNTTSAAGPTDSGLSRQATELVLTPTSSSVVTLHVPISSRMQCFVQASWVESTILAALPSGHRLLPTAAQALLDATATLTEADLDAHYPLITQLLFGLSLRASALSDDQMAHSMEILASVLPSLATSSVTLSSTRSLEVLIKAASNLIESARYRLGGAAATTSASSLSRSLRNSSAENGSPSQLERTLCTVFATSIAQLGKIPWRARLALQKPLTELLGFDPSTLGGDEIYDSIQSRLMLCLEDSDVRVRAAASKSICALFSYFSAHRVIVGDLLKGPIRNLLDMPTHLEAIATCLTALEAISSESPLVLDSVLFALHEACAQHHIFTTYVPLILDAQSASLGYASRLNMLLDRLPLVFSRWTKLVQFPSFLYNEPDIITFTSKYAGLLIQGLIRPTSADGEEISAEGLLRNIRPLPTAQLADIAKLAASTTQSLLKGSYYTVLAVITLLRAAKQVSAADALESLLGAPVKPTKRNTAHMASFSLVSSIFHLLRLVGESLEASDLMLVEGIETSFKAMTSALSANQPPASAPGERKSSKAKSKKASSDEETAVFSPSTLASALELLATNLNFASVSRMLAYSNFYMLAHVLKSIEEWFFRTSDPTERARAVFAVNAIVATAAPPIVASSMILATLFRFLHNSTHTSLQTVVLVTIRCVWQAIPSDTSTVLLRSASFMDSLVDAISDPIQSQKIRNHGSTSDLARFEIEMRQLLQVMLLTPTGSPRESITSYGRFPGFVHPIFETINDTLDKASLATNQWDFIYNLAHQSSSDSSSVKVLTALDQFLKGAYLHRDQICAALASKESTDSLAPTQPNLSRSALAESIRSLVKLSKSSDTQVQGRVAEALGVIGLFESSLLESRVSPLLDNSSLTRSLSMSPTAPLQAKDVIDIDEMDAIFATPSAPAATASATMDISDDDQVPDSSHSKTTILSVEALRIELMDCLKLSTHPSKEALFPLLKLLALKERSSSYSISGIARGILNTITTGFCDGRHSPLTDTEDFTFFVSCWKNFSKNQVSNYLTAPKQAATMASTSVWDSALKMPRYETWITSLCSHLARTTEDPILKACHDLLATDAEFSELMFPLLLADVFRQKGDEMASFELFIQRAIEKSSSKIISRRKSFTTILTSLQAIRSAAIALAASSASKSSSSRIAPHPSGTPTRKSSRALQMQDLIPNFAFLQSRTSYNVATLSLAVGLPCTSLAFFEHWCETVVSASGANSSSFGTLRLPDDPNSSSLGLTLAQAIYSALGDTDGVYGLHHHHSENASRALDSTSLSFLLMQERNWSGVLDLFEVGARPSAQTPMPAAMHRNMLTALQNGGHFEIMRHYVAGLMTRPTNSEDISEFHFQAAWRLSDWNATWTAATQSNFNHTSATPHSNHAFPFHRLAFTSLRTALQGDRNDAKELLDVARVQLVQSELSFVSGENRDQVQPIVAQLQFFTEIQQALEKMNQMASVKKPSVAPSRASLFSSPLAAESNAKASIVDLSGAQALKEWNQSLETMRKATNRVELFEPLIALRGILLPQIISTQNQHEAQSSYWTSVLVASRKSKNFQMASVALENARSALQSFQKSNAQGPTFKKVPSSQIEGATVQSRYTDLSRRFAIEECRFYWFQGKQTEAVALAKAQLKILEKSGQSYDLAKMLLLIGEWLGDSKIESPNVIIEQYLKRASEMLRVLKQEATIRCKAYFDLGSFADHQYQLAMDRISSVEWNETMALQKKIQSENTGIVDDRSRKTHTTLFKQEISTPGREEQDQKIKEYLLMAVQMYLYALLKGQKRDTSAVFRLVSLWFSHSNEPRLAVTIKNNITKVSSFKFLPLFYQIASRISSAPAQNDFQKALQDLIVKITVDHPHPSFYQLIALMNAGEPGVHTAPSTIDKSKIAERLISHVRARIPVIADGMAALAMGYMELANHNFPKDVGSSTKLPTKLLLSFKHPAVIPVATTTTTAKTSAGLFASDTPGLVTIMGFETTCKFVGGVNLPRLIYCRGSDGKSYPQLVKGKDDLRQDAVMQQLFHTINVLLKSDTESSQPNLRIRSYNVIPLSPSAGVLEWVSNTQPVGDYLITLPYGAHIRYRPEDWLHSKCRETMDRVSRQTEEKRHSEFQEVLKNFRPVLHHFFIENFPEPGVWYEKRLSYTRSMAVASIIGHMVGLGDRHSQNILLDKLTGEVVHIDLGIAFDQGKTLPVPELVPFRLTRDLVDALGVIGVRGVFLKSCENVVRTLREHHANLVTIAQVFLHDPLSKWLLRVTANAAHERTGVIDLETDESTEPLALIKPGGAILEEAGSRNTKAATTLLRFKQKLLGQEEGVALSVAGQVQHLITAAQDERKLALMYPGWAPWV